MSADEKWSESYKQTGPGFTLRISNELRDAVDEEAKKLGLSRTQIIIALLEGYLDGTIKISRPKASGSLKLPRG